MQDLKKRFMQFAIDNAMLISKLPTGIINRAYSNQLIRSSSSPGTNYRAALRGKSSLDFINKLTIVEEELDESMYFLELLHYFNPDDRKEIEAILNEANELPAITVSSIRNARTNAGQRT